MSYVKSPLNYTGGKYKLLHQIIPKLPTKINTFVDLFAGGGNVFANVNAENYVVNDKQKQVVKLLQYLHDFSNKDVVDDVMRIIKDYRLVKNEKEAYMRIRKDYNDGVNSSAMFFVLICHSFNHQIRFNKSGGFNMPVGLGTFNEKIRENLQSFQGRIRQFDIKFSCCDFDEIESEHIFKPGDFLYCDPPYLITTASYNEQGGWGDEHELRLLSLLDRLNEKGVRFALSNVTEHKERNNVILTEWSEKYNVFQLKHSYANCNYQSTKKDSKTSEVLVTNYDLEAE